MGSHAADEYARFFLDNVVFLTGATGNLGSCTLWKLIAQLNVAQVYALVRGSKEQAIEKLRRKLRSHASAVLTSNIVHFIVGDMRLPGWGISAADLETLRNDVNIVIHTAANLSLLDPISECIANNCDPVLELARLATSFTKLRKFVFVSSVYVNSFLPDGLVKEKIYLLLDESGEDIDPELEREEISRTGYSALTQRFAWPYAFSKYLGERLLLERYSSLPLLIARSSTIGPAVRDPFPLFGDEESLPIQQAARIYCRDPEASSHWHVPANSSSGTNILDEIPVDWVGNVLLLQIANDARGVVHASAGNYMRQTSDDILQSVRHTGAKEARGIRWISPDAGPQCALANHFVVGNRDWDFDCKKSAMLQQVEGPLSIRATLQEVKSFIDFRFLALLKEVEEEFATYSDKFG